MAVISHPGRLGAMLYAALGCRGSQTRMGRVCSKKVMGLGSTVGL